jgi:general secretion pathway protein G
MKRKPSRRNGGFTLIEVLLVLVILVILASLAVVNILSIKKNANEKAAKVQIELLSNALETYSVTVGTYPSQAAGLQALRTRPADLQDPEKWSQTLDRDIPLDPWGKQYIYACPGVHNQDRFDVYTTTPDGREIGNWTEVK